MTGEPAGALPHVVAHVQSDQHARVTFNGASYELTGGEANETRDNALNFVTRIASDLGGPVSVDLIYPGGAGWQLVMEPNGSVTAERPLNVDYSAAPADDTAPPAAPERPVGQPAQVADPENPAIPAGEDRGLVDRIPDESTIRRETATPVASPFAPPGQHSTEPDGSRHEDAGQHSDGHHVPDQHGVVQPSTEGLTTSQAPEQAQAPQYEGLASSQAPEQAQAPQYPEQHLPGQASSQAPHSGLQHAADQIQPQSGQPHYGGPASSQAPAQAAPYGQSQYGQPQYGGPASSQAPAQAAPYGQPQYGQPQYAQQQSGQPQLHYGDPNQPGYGHDPAALAGQGQQPGEFPRRRDLRQSFLRAEQSEAPASQGVRGALTKIGIKTKPSAAERSLRADVDAVSQHWPGVRTIAIVNGKGGANKTPTTALLAAVFARNSGAATLAWDNNETRGTLGWRTEQGKHEATVQDLLPEGEALLDPSAKAGDISHFVHHQAADKYDVLRSNPSLLSSEQRITGEDVDLVHDVAGRYYRLIFIDSGNDESADHWLRMIGKTDQLVVATIAKPEHAEAGALLLEALANRDEHAAKLARQAVVVVSQAREKDVNPSATEIARGFHGWVREVVTIPYDRAMVESVLRFESLDPATQRAWLRAGAAVAGGL